MGNQVLITADPWDAPEGAALRAAQRAELDERYGTDDHEPGTAPGADDMAVFLVARSEQGAPLGCGGLRRLSAGTAEIKRMYVVPSARGTGVSVALLRALEAEADRLGLSDLVLETGTLQPDAMRFYEREGYARTPNFGPYVGEELSVCYSRTL